MSASCFTPDLRLTPYWWDHVPRPALPAATPPTQADVVVIGSGYTGLHAALQTARAGRHTVVLDAEDAGFGCSTRNGGQISTSIKPGFADLARRHGADRARQIIQEGQRSLTWLDEFIRGEGLDCNFGVVGRFHAAHNAQQFTQLARAAEQQTPGLEVPAVVVPRAEQRREIGTDAYWGGVLYTAHASVDPARYHQGLLDRVLASGATVLARSPALRIDRDGDGHRVHLPQGSIRARQVVVATNGYTGTVTPWLRRRVIPIGSYIIATEPLAPELARELIPKQRIVSDSRRVVYYYRLSPDGRRMLFGGRVSTHETDPRISGPLLRDDMVALFPQLASTRISHSWAGFVAYSFDSLMHIGRHEGLYYAMGYCGSGVGMGSYLGMRLGQQVLGRPEGRTAFDELPFPTRPLYTGKPWFLAASVRYYRWLDRRPG